MNRAIILVIIVVLAAGAFLLGRLSARDSASGEAAVTADSVWYRASDVAQLARTGRPQLVEFFHPG